MHSVSIQSAFGSFLRELREKSGLHIEQLAEKTGLSSSHLTAIERGEVNLNLETMLILAMSMDTSLQEFLRGIAGRIASAQPIQIKPKELWIGLVEVRPLAGCDIFDETQGALVDIVTSAASAYEYGLKVGLLVRKLRLFVLSIANAEPVEKRRERQGFLEESVEDIILGAQGNPQAIICGVFHIYEKNDV